MMVTLEEASEVTAENGYIALTPDELKNLLRLRANASYASALQHAAHPSEQSTIYSKRASTYKQELQRRLDELFGEEEDV